MLSEEIEIIWNQIISEVEILVNKDTELTGFYHAYILQHKTFDMALSYILSSKLSNKYISQVTIRDIFNEIYSVCNDILFFAIKDIQAVCNKNSEIKYYFVPLLYLKSFHALQIYRISNFLWYNGKKSLALYFQNAISSLFSVNIHPAAKIGHGIVLEYGTNICIGSTSIIENNVFIAQCVTLGRTEKDSRGVVQHPKVCEGVIIGANSMILGNITIGTKTNIQAGSLILTSVPDNSVVCGIPATIISKKHEKN
ncbi:MAG: serine O-acetyltransferase [Buchnera aphidicola (Chaetogeoica yunlongensis)]